MEFKESILTGINVEKRSFIWTIDNFNIIRKSKYFTNSQKLAFHAGETIGLETEWRFHLDWYNEKVERVDKPWIGIHFELSKISETDFMEEVNAAAEIIIKGSDANVTYFHGDSSLVNYFRDGEKFGWEWQKIIPQDAGLNDLPLVEGSLVIQIEFQLFAPKSLLKINSEKNLAAIEDRYKVTFSEKLQKDLGMLPCTSSQMPEGKMKIVTKDKHEFTTNQVILSARSQVFEKMFQWDMRESKAGVIHIDDISSKTMAVLLRFIYTGTLHKAWRDADVIAELVYASEKYELSDLLEFLSEVIGFVCTKENAGKLMNLAKKIHTLRKAETDLMEFMKKNILSFDDMVSFVQPHYDKYSPDESDGEFNVNNVWEKIRKCDARRWHLDIIIIILIVKILFMLG